jgi:hypothetical protein
MENKESSFTIEWMGNPWAEMDEAGRRLLKPEHRIKSG